MANLATKVMIFDSGVGGLSIAQAVMKKCPTVEIIFACDNLGFPYGTKKESELVSRVDLVLHDFVKNHQPDILVVACNTASTVVLPIIRSKFTLPIVGVVPAIKPAAALTKTKVIGLLATPATVARPYTQELIDEFAKECTVIRVGTSELVQIVEDKMRSKPVDVNAIKNILVPFFCDTALTMDTMVLACTHFPLLRDEIQAIVGKAVTLVDSGSAIAARVKTLLKDITKPGDSHPKHKAIFTQQSSETKLLVPALSQLGFTP